MSSTDDVDVRVVHQGAPVGGHGRAHGLDVGPARLVALGDGRDADVAARAVHHLAAVHVQDPGQARAHRAETRQADVQLVQHPSPSSMTFFRPRMAWAVRCLFSMSAKRTWSSP